MTLTYACDRVRCRRDCSPTVEAIRHATPYSWSIRQAWCQPR